METERFPQKKLPLAIPCKACKNRPYAWGFPYSAAINYKPAARRSNFHILLHWTLAQGSFPYVFFLVIQKRR